MAPLCIPIEYSPPFRLRHHEEHGHAQHAFWLGDQPVVFRFHQDGDDGPLTVAAYSDRPLEPIADRVQVAARRATSADDDPTEFRAAIAGDAPMAALADRLPGLKPLRVPDLWTALLWGLIDQQISRESARAIRDRFARRFGPRIDVEGDSAHVFPAPRTVLEVPHEELCEAGLSERKAEYAKEIASAVVAGDVDLETTAALPTDQALQHLVDLRGVGTWTAEVAAIFGLGARDILPAGDLAIRKAIGHLYHLPHVPEEEEVRRIGERWAGWRSYAAVYLWWSRRAAPVAARPR